MKPYSPITKCHRYRRLHDPVPTRLRRVKPAPNCPDDKLVASSWPRRQR